MPHTKTLPTELLDALLSGYQKPEDMNRPGFLGCPNLRENGVMKEKTVKQYSPEIRERAVRMVREHQSEYPSEWATIQSL